MVWFYRRIIIYNSDYKDIEIYSFPLVIAVTIVASTFLFRLCGDNLRYRQVFKNKHFVGGKP